MIILLNWPCGIWKSTIAKLLWDKIPMSLLREKDVQKRNFSHYKDTKENQRISADLILKLTKNVIKFGIENNQTIIFDSILRQEEIIKDFEKFVVENWWKILHILLNAPKNIWKERILERWISGSFTFERAEMFYDNLQIIKNIWNMIEIDTSDTNPEKICKIILDKII